MTLVDENDRLVGQAERKICHQFPGKLHRAILVVVFDQRGQILLAKRVKGKLWQGIWDGTVATHIFPKESPQQAAKRALSSELGINHLTLKPHHFFVYQAKWKDKGVENEVCHLFTVKVNQPIQANKKEVTTLKWTHPKDLRKEIKKNPADFSPWFLEALKRL